MPGPLPPIKSKPSPLVLALAERWATLLRRERELEAERRAVGEELLPYARGWGELPLDAGGAVTLERSSSRETLTLGRLIKAAGHDAAAVIWRTLGEKTSERLHLREPSSPSTEAPDASAG